MPGFDRQAPGPSGFGSCQGFQTRLWGLSGETRKVCGGDHIMSLASACGFAEAMAPEKGGAVAGANSDNWRPPNQAGSEQDARKACPKPQGNVTPRNTHRYGQCTDGDGFVSLWARLAIVTSSAIITVSCWLSRSCSPRRNGYLAGLGIVAVGQNGCSWHIVDFCHQFRRYPQLLSTSISKGHLTASKSRKSGGIRRVWAVRRAGWPA